MDENDDIEANNTPQGEDHTFPITNPTANDNSGTTTIQSNVNILHATQIPLRERSEFTPPGPSTLIPTRQKSDPITEKEKSRADVETGNPERDSRGSFSKATGGIKRQLIQSNSIFSDFLGVGSMARQSVRLFYCTICMENQAVSDAFVLTNCKGNHQFCLDCMKGYTTSQINSGVTLHVCPHESCVERALDTEIEMLVEPELYEKYMRFKTIKENPDYRECGKCNRELKFSLDAKNKSDCMLTCECGTISCFFHGDAHPNETCAQYARRIKRVEQETEKMVKRIARKCPSCKSETEKNGGCNHMVRIRG